MTALGRALVALGLCAVPGALTALPSAPQDVSERAGERLGLAPREVRRFLQHAPLGDVPPDETNAWADDPDAAALGQRLFFDPRLSADGSTSCATCHDPSAGFADGRQLSEGLQQLAERHPHVMVGERGRGLMRAMLVRNRDEVVHKGWEHGIKLLGCGWSGEVAPIRLLMLADTLAREVDELLGIMDRVFASMKP